MSHHLLSLGRTTLFFLSSVLALAPACSPGAPDDPADPSEDIAAGEAEQPLASVRLRVMAGNITSGNYQSYDPGHGIRIFKGTAPDIAMIQEFNYGANTAADIRAFVDAAFGTSFAYYREGGAQIPNGIVSRWPILESGEWDDASVSNRDFAWARIDIPGPTDLWAVSVHLLTSSSTSRNTEAQQLVSYIQGKVPAAHYLVIGGDFNTGSRTEACVSTLSQVVTTAGPYPADRNGNSGTNASRGSPYDWVLVDADLSAYKTSVTIGASTFASGLVADTRVYSPIAEISPALAADSGATNMQHMGIVRDFLIPGDSVPTPPPPGSPAVFVNEILANEPGSDPVGEFVEIVNAGTAAADLSGFTLADSVSARHTFAAGTTLGAGAAAVVFGGATAIPAGLAGSVAASTGTLGLSNSGDTVTLRDAAGASVDSFTYGSSLSGTDGVSMNRSPDAASGSGFVLHTGLSSSSSSPGAHADGSGF
jgi:endonuclease/exonuclease/phosphatase family metal-dependent hydrolase